MAQVRRNDVVSFPSDASVGDEGFGPVCVRSRREEMAGRVDLRTKTIISVRSCCSTCLARQSLVIRSIFARADGYRFNTAHQLFSLSLSGGNVNQYSRTKLFPVPLHRSKQSLTCVSGLISRSYGDVRRVIFSARERGEHSRLVRDQLMRCTQLIRPDEVRFSLERYSRTSRRPALVDPPVDRRYVRCHGLASLWAEARERRPSSRRREVLHRLPCLFRMRLQEVSWL